MTDRQDDEAARLRGVEAARVDRSGRRDRDFTAGTPSLVAQTTTQKTYPTSAPRFYACLPMTVLGPEVEGGPGTLTPGATTFLALNLGSAVPPAGTSILATFVDNRWVFRHDG